MFAKSKTKIICTIGPASRAPETLEKLLLTGMDIARLNFSHGDFKTHEEDVKSIRKAADSVGKQVAIMADLPGPKIRIGDLDQEPMELKNDELLTLTTEPNVGTRGKIHVNLPGLPHAVGEGNFIFVNDGFIQLKVLEVRGKDVVCKVVVGGTLSSRKGVNIPDVDLGVTAFTEKDRQIVEFALDIGVDGLSQSFVEESDDIKALRKFVHKLGYDPFIIAKIERSKAVCNLDNILREADGIMVARGDLGVEIPICRIPVVQKEIVHRANRLGKPVITATHMLESMITNRLPTRAEATDVANAILDGTDCVMLSGESAVGRYPVEAVSTLCAIAAEAEKVRGTFTRTTKLWKKKQEDIDISDLIASSVDTAIEQITPAAVIIPTRSGATARNVTRYRLPVWIIAVSSRKKTCQELLFSYGVLPVFELEHPTFWRQWIREKLQLFGIEGMRAILTEGPSSKYPDRNDRMEIIDLTRK